MNFGATFDIKEVTKNLNAMVDRANLPSGYLNRVVYPRLLKDQRERWMTEGASQTGTWRPLKPAYAAYKRKKYAAYDGSGTKLLIATGTLVKSMTGDDRANHYKMVTDRKLEFGTLIPYAKYVNDARDITQLNNATIKDIASGLAKYIKSGNVK